MIGERWAFAAILLVAAARPLGAQAVGAQSPSPPASAAPGARAPAPLSLEEVLAVARRQNPDLLATRLRTDSARAERRIARALPNPDVALAPNTPYQYGVTQSLDLGPARLYRTRAAARGETASRLDVLDAERQVVFSVRQGFYDLLLAEGMADLARQSRDIFRQVLAADSARLRTGDVPVANVAKSELELSRAEADLDRAVAAVHAARLSLQLLMGIADPDTAFAVSGALAYRPVAVPFDSLAAIAAAGRPDVRAAAERAAQSRALKSLATAQLVPVPSVSLVYQDQPFTNAPLVNNRNVTLGFGFSVPLFYWYGGERARAQAGIAAADLERTRLQAQVANDVATAADAFRVARGLAERYEGGLLARADSVLSTTRYAYRAGAASLLDLLDAVRTWLDTRGDYLTSVHDYWVDLFAIDRAVGRDIGP